jgi:hypothetical protein
MSEEFYEKAGPFDNLGDILNYLLNLRLPEKKENNLNEYWSFRGQRKQDWDLSITPRPDKNGTSVIPNGQFDYKDWLSQYKKRMLKDRELDYLNDKNPWWWLFYAKHHRLHTRLLDWSSNPLVAIYFAVENILSHENDKTEGAVWALKVNEKRFHSADKLWPKTEWLDSGELIEPPSGLIMDKNNKPIREMNDDEWFMVNPDPVTPRIAIQSSKFTYHPGKNPTPIDQIKRRLSEKEELIKIKIKHEGNAKIRRQLGIMNIHHASLFPSPTGTALFVNSEWPDIARY